ncbi:Bacteriophage replication gene A protein (GPA) [Vreelandella subterranea]|uniref:Bacteriophage replication gene A protein (GPA) n=1 Tax=Vreelandella subterranea TaxID=416874 RepID=A0A1H9WG13_9GAMM|nr:replication endonuclease [Halomonas subterranea]SES32741.1 Bacteriophage replication gene A protein (GPA) [Halomonas subterranea]
MSTLELAFEYSSRTRDCRRFLDEHWKRLPSIAEQLAGGYIHVSKQHGHAAANRWLRRNAAELIDPASVYRRFTPIASDLERGFQSLVKRAPTTIEGLQIGCRWLASVEERLVLNGYNVTHDDEAAINHAEAQASALERERSKLIGGIAEHNRRLRLGLLPPPLNLKTPKARTLSGQAREIALQIADSRNPLSPPLGIIPLMAVFKWHRAPVMSLPVVNEMALQKARHRARLHGINPPSLKMKSAVQLAKLTDPLWWRRQLRRLGGRRLEQVQREAHRVHKRAGIYCSDVTLERRRAQKNRNHALLDALEAINQEGQVYTLAELAELGLSNPDHRRAELMLRIRDTEVEARRLGHVGMFYTITAPSRFHPVHAKSGARNTKYDGSTPRDAQAYLQQVWARTRAKLAREDIGVYGIRVVEPHHDGTPHWHLLVWTAPEHADTVTEILGCHAEADTPEELYDRRGHKSTARFKVEPIDYTRGTAAGYVAKYISKNINGEQFARDGMKDDDKDSYGHDLNSSAPRIESWAAVWGIRQFQFVGLPSVTVWREIRRLNDKHLDELDNWEKATRPEARIAARFEQIRKAANSGQWDQFLRLMGGPNLPRKYRPVKPWTMPRVDLSRAEFSHATGEEREGVEALGRHGESKIGTFGIVVTDGRGNEHEYLTRFYRWQVRGRSLSDQGGSGSGEAASPWTRVTNCTQGPDIQPREPTPEEKKAQRERLEEWKRSEIYRAEMEDSFHEAQEAREAARNLFAPPPPTQQEEYFPTELC